ncbi:MAG TPA: NUDIX hydrolase [Mycobacteriales bacterium]|nr:NUDIX hydrolase [Mycobacteriales bacterium]
MLLDGDGWTRCRRGHRHWGRHGAAGLLLHHLDPGGTCWVLLQHRAWWSHHGGTWGVPGGAMARGESAVQAALREVSEEVTVDLAAVRVTGELADDHGAWSYTTVLADCGERLACAPCSAESTDVRWFATEDVGGLTLHPGFAATWPQLLPLLG